MKLKKNLVFLGMMGSGKTSIGLIVSKKLKSNFIDIDEEIEKKIGMKISKIFETKGENFFRELEEKITLKILQKSNCVISLGGGAFEERGAGGGGHANSCPTMGGVSFLKRRWAWGADGDASPDRCSL